MQKLYAYVDESGQDTLGELFIVSVVITEKRREKLIRKLECIEKTSQKGRRKWVKARLGQRTAYIKGVLKIPSLKDKLIYSIYRKTTEYLSCTVITTAQAISFHVEGEYKAVIFVDGLRKSQVKWFGSELRHLHIRTEKVKGVRKEENDTLTRLADALAGFVRAAIEGQENLASLFKKARKEGYIREI